MCVWEALVFCSKIFSRLKFKLVGLMLRKQRLECNESIEVPTCSFIVDGHGKNLDSIFPCVYVRNLREELICSRDMKKICSMPWFVTL